MESQAWSMSMVLWLALRRLQGRLDTNIPLLVGQMTPDESSYNFNGLIDEVMIYNYTHKK